MTIKTGSGIGWAQESNTVYDGIAVSVGHSPQHDSCHHMPFHGIQLATGWRTVSRPFYK